jgi:hypothetical protein
MPRKSCPFCGELIRKRNFEEDKCCDSFMGSMELHVFCRCPLTWKKCRSCDHQYRRDKTHVCHAEEPPAETLTLGQWIDCYDQGTWRPGLFAGTTCRGHNYAFLIPSFPERARRQRVQKIAPFRVFTRKKNLVHMPDTIKVREIKLITRKADQDYQICTMCNQWHTASNWKENFVCSVCTVDLEEDGLREMSSEEDF